MHTHPETQPHAVQNCLDGYGKREYPQAHVARQVVECAQRERHRTHHGTVRRPRPLRPTLRYPLSGVSGTVFPLTTAQHLVLQAHRSDLFVCGDPHRASGIWSSQTATSRPCSRRRPVAVRGIEKRQLMTYTATETADALSGVETRVSGVGGPAVYFSQPQTAIGIRYT
jgi:hypothetical protein